MSTPAKLPAFKAYDIRGKVPSELNAPMAYWLGRGFAQVSGAQTAVLGMDARLTSPAILAALAHGLADAGVKVQTINLCGTEEVYFATGHYGVDLGLIVTASHNPADYNGIKPILTGGQPFLAEHMAQLHAYTVENMHQPIPANHHPAPQPLNHRQAFIAKVLSFVDVNTLKPFKILSNPGNGAAGPTADALFEKLPFTVTRLNHQPDGTFPNGLPNPMLPGNRAQTAAATVQAGADFAVAWEGDFDRFFLFDETGAFVPPYYLVGLLAEALLRRHPGSTIVYEPRLYWDTLATLAAHGGTPAVTRCGHVFFKQKMRETGAIFGGETSAHFFFREFYSCDSGMIPWLLIAQLMSQTGQKLSQLVASRRQGTSIIDETNFTLTTTPAPAVLEALQQAFPAAEVEKIDGLGLTGPNWRANVRSSNTEPLLRLNLEARTPEVLNDMTTRLTTLLQSLGALPADH